MLQIQVHDPCAAAVASGASQGGRAIAVDRRQARRSNALNGIVVKRGGSPCFTGTPAGMLPARRGRRADGEPGRCHVVRFEPATVALQVPSNFVEEADDQAFSPAESVSCVHDTPAALLTDGAGHRHIVGSGVPGGRKLDRARRFAVTEPGLADGVRVDMHGFLHTSTADSRQVFRSDGLRIGRIPVPGWVGNLLSRGEGGNERLICAGTSLYRTVLHVRGASA